MDVLRPYNAVRMPWTVPALPTSSVPAPEPRDESVLAAVPAEEPVRASFLGTASRIALMGLVGVLAAGALTPTVAAEMAPVVASTSSVLKQPNRYEINARLEAAAARHKVPADVLKAIAWQESGWQHYESGRVVVNVNRDARTGKAVSTDWGILQINDKAHQSAFPRARDDIDFNVNYGAQLLSWLHKENGGNWNRTIERYNGINPSYRRAIERHRQRQPWLQGVKQDELATRVAEREALAVRIAEAEATSRIADARLASLTDALAELDGEIATLKKTVDNFKAVSKR